MRGPQPSAIVLSSGERQALEALVRRHTTPQQLVLRVRLGLAAAAGATNGQIGRQWAVSLDLVRRWRARWVALPPATLEELPGAERLTEMPRPGKPVRITAEQVCQMVALAGASPTDSARPISQWTSRELAAEMVHRGIVPQLSARHAARLLKRGTCARS